MVVDQIKMGDDYRVNLLDHGLLWKDADRLAVREVLLVDHTIEHKNKCRTIRLIVVKSCYLIILHIKFNEEIDCSVELLSHVAFGSGPSNVVSVEPIQTKAEEKQFIVACREGPLHILTLPSSPSNEASSANMVGVELFSRNADGGPTDTKNYRCHGFTKSNNGSIWVFLQNGFLDEQAKFSKGRLTFLTQQTYSSLSKIIMDESSSAVSTGIPSLSLIHI